MQTKHKEHRAQNCYKDPKNNCKQKKKLQGNIKGLEKEIQNCFNKTQNDWKETNDTAKTISLSLSVWLSCYLAVGGLLHFSALRPIVLSLRD